MLKNLNIKLRLSLGFGLVLSFLIIVGVFGAYNVDIVHDQVEIIYNHPFTVVDALRDAHTNFIKMHRGMKDVVMSANAAELENAITSVNESEKIVYERLKLVNERFLGGKDKVDELVKEFDAWKPVRAKVIGLMRANKKDMAMAAHKSLAFQSTSRIEEKMSSVIEFARGKALSIYNTATAIEARSYRIIYSILAATIILTLIIALMITSSITVPLKKAVEVADRMAVGDMTSEIKVTSTDETGQLLKSMDNMVRSLKDMAKTADRIATGDLTVDIAPRSDRDVLGIAMKNMVGSMSAMAGAASKIAGGDLTANVTPHSDRDVLGNALSAMIKNLRKQTREITEAINVLASSVTEIMASSSQLASSSSETAASVSETTSTVEEVRQTAQVSSQKAQYVSESSRKVVEVSQNGSKAVDATVEGMNEIRAQMESIAENIVMLSEQSQAIGEIISSVNDLAEQSNLLAVNAAIEAAKAGEHGRGFSVVAQEVKSLAEQSKQATAQVRTILNDIQKATGKAVLVTEHGTKAVAEGVRQSSEAGSAIRTLSKSVSEASQAATQIVASNQQQLIGMEQVAMAMENIKQASTQNADSIRQVESASKNLHELVQRLKQMAELYKV